MKSSPIANLSTQPLTLRLRSAGLADPTAPADATPATDLLLELGPAERPGQSPAPPRRAFRVLAAASPADLDAHPAAARAEALDLTHAVLLPALANAHTHLDLTHIGPIPHDPAEGFVAWVDRVREGRAQTPQAIADAVGLGIDLSLRAGVALVGDIAGAPRGRPTLVPHRTLAASPMAGVSFLEFFAMGLGEAEAFHRLEKALAEAEALGLLSSDPLAPVRLGLQPHATNTVSLPAYRRAVDIARRHALPLATHLAESPEEREFIARASGPHRAFVERFGFWTDDLLEHLGRGRTPVEHLAPALERAAFLVAHVNDAGPDPEATFAILARTGASVAYCPRASEYFGAEAHFGPHRYRDMLSAGVNVCLGTDSILNLPPGVEAPEGPGLSVLDEARLLFRRDGTDPATLLRMCTTNSARALGVAESAFALSPEAHAPPLGLVLVDVGGTPAHAPPFERALRARAHARGLLLNTPPA